VHRAAFGTRARACRGLDEVLSLAAGTVQGGVEPFGGAAGQIGHHVADVQSLRGGLDACSQAAPASQDLLLRAAERNSNLGAITVGLSRLLDRYGTAEPQFAIREAVDRGVPHPNAVRIALERRREARGEAPPVAIELPPNVQARDAPVQPYALKTCDQLKDAADE
jgi:hypothetical protein